MIIISVTLITGTIITLISIPILLFELALVLGLVLFISVLIRFRTFTVIACKGGSNVA